METLNEQEVNNATLTHQSIFERWQYKKLRSSVFNIDLEPWDDLDDTISYVRYKILCLNFNLTP